jgi:hypothetical protein
MLFSLSRQDGGELTGRLSRTRASLRNDEMVVISVEDIYLPPNRGEWLQLLLTVEREGGGGSRAKRSPQGGFNSGGSGSGGGGFNTGGSSGGGGFNTGGSSGGAGGGFNNGGGGFNNGGSGGFNNGGGGFNNGGSSGGSGGGFNNGGSSSGGRPDLSGGNNGGFNSGGNNGGGFNGGGGAGGRPDISNNNNNNNGGFNGGSNSGGRPDVGGGSGGRPDLGGPNNGGYNNGGSGGYNGGGYNNGGYSGGGGYNNGREQGRPGFNDPWTQGAGGSNSRPDYNQPPGGRSHLQTSVLFRVTSGYVAPDIDQPNVRLEAAESAACTTAHHCAEQDWTLRFVVQDDGAGLFATRLSGGDGRLFWWRENHMVGGRDAVRVGAIVSCCTLAVSLEAEDMAANQVSLLGAQPEVGMNWRIVIGVSVGVGVLVVILIGVFGTCLYRKKYHGVPQDGL